MPGKFILYLQGYLRIRISGLSAERFINACSYRGIRMWDLSPTDSYYDISITIKDFKKLKPVIHKTRTKVIILERTGFPFFLKKYKKRNSFFVGFVVCIIIIFSFTSFVWNIEIKGNSSYSTENLLAFLNAMDIKEGTKVKDIDCKLISNKIRHNFNDIIWVSTSINGSQLIIQIKENEDFKKMEMNSNNDTPYDILAEDDFQVSRIIIRKGIIQVNTGDYVHKGDILVSGNIPIYNDAKEVISYQSCVSDADIYGKKTLMYEEELALSTFNKKHQDVQKTEYSLKFNNQRILFGSICNEYDYFEENSKQFKFGNLTLEARHVVPYKKIPKKYSKVEIQKILSSNFNYYCQELRKKGVVILKNNVKIYTWSDRAKATGTLIIEKPIGYIVKSQLLEMGEYIDGNDGNNN